MKQGKDHTVATSGFVGCVQLCSCSPVPVELTNHRQDVWQKFIFSFLKSMQVRFGSYIKLANLFVFLCSQVP